MSARTEALDEQKAQDKVAVMAKVAEMLGIDADAFGKITALIHDVPDAVDKLTETADRERERKARDRKLEAQAAFRGKLEAYVRGLVQTECATDGCDGGDDCTHVWEYAGDVDAIIREHGAKLTLSANENGEIIALFSGFAGGGSSNRSGGGGGRYTITHNGETFTSWKRFCEAHGRHAELGKHDCHREMDRDQKNGKITFDAVKDEGE